MDFRQIKKALKRFWRFVWEDDSIWSWLVNVGLAFLLIKFIVYPGMGFVFHTSHPIVAVVSSSMEHDGSFDDWWPKGGNWYLSKNITKDEFRVFPLSNGFNKGDIILLFGKKTQDIKIGDVIVFISHRSRPRQDPIIHRVVMAREENGELIFQTKGDNYRTNANSINSCDSKGCIDETDISEEQIIGSTLLRIPLLGYIKIWFVKLLCLFGDFSFCL